MKKHRYSIFVLILLIVMSCEPAKKEDQPANKAWWKEAIVYQIYPRSFKDSDGDGVGDLKGIISKMDYIKSLGITAVWLNPIYESPNDDNGYDVSDYRAILKEFGTMEDFDTMLKGFHERGIKVVMDVVVNHSSDEHEWFKQSRSSRDNKYRDYYHWWPAEKGKPPYRHSLFDVNGDAWMYDSTTNAYYLHYFSRKQPDLNWENPAVRQEVYDIMKFWADKGVDGFRLDAFQFASKDITYPEYPGLSPTNFIEFYAMGPFLHDYLKEMNQEVFSKYDVMSVAEGAGKTYQDAHDLVDADRNELNMAYAFDGVDIPKPEGYSLLKFKKVFSEWDSAFAEKGWLSIFLANHDQARMVSRYANDSPEYRAYSAKMLSTFILTMRGTPYVYYGDELGMSNPGFTDISQYKDISALNEYQRTKNNGGDIDKFMKALQFGSRDNGRTPMQWNSEANAGFTTGDPWIELNPNYAEVNVEQEQNDPQSVLTYFRELTDLRKSNPVLVYGKYTLLDPENENVYAYTREWEGELWTVMLNFSDSEGRVDSDIDWSKQNLVLGNYESPRTDGTLRPYEAVIVKR